MFERTKELHSNNAELLNFLKEAEELNVQLKDETNHSVSFYIPYEEYDANGCFLIAIYDNDSISVWYDHTDRLFGDFYLGEFNYSVGLKNIIEKCKIIMTRCPECGKEFNFKDVRHVAFANWCCPDCYDKAVEKYEFTGWAD